MSADIESITRYRAALGNLLYWDTPIAAPIPLRGKRFKSGPPKRAWGKRFKSAQMDRRKAAVRELGEAMPPLLKVFKKFHSDASAIFRFWYEETAYNPSPPAKHFFASDVRAALSNLELQAFGNTETPPPDDNPVAQLVNFVGENPTAKAPAIAAAIHKSLPHTKRLIAQAIADRQIKRIQGRQGYVPA